VPQLKALIIFCQTYWSTCRTSAAVSRYKTKRELCDCLVLVPGSYIV